MVPENEIVAPHVSAADRQVDVILARYAPPEKVPAWYPLLAAVGVARRLQCGDTRVETSRIIDPNQRVENRFRGESRHRRAADVLDRGGDAMRAQRGVDILALHLE